MLAAALLVLAADPLATLAEPELSVPDLGARYAAAAGEPVEVLPALKRRAVAVFVKREPWERVLALAGEAGGFRLARKDGRLRLETTRFFDLATLQKAAEKGLAPYAQPVDDVRKGFPAYLEADRATDEGRGKPTEVRARLAARRKSLLAASSPERLVLARYLKRGGTLPLGKTVAVRFADYVPPAEFAAWDLGNEGLRAPTIAAFRLGDREVEIGLNLEAETEGRLPGFHPLTLPISAASSYTEGGFDRTDLPDPAGSVPWAKAPAPPRPLGVYRVSDVLGWIHAATGRPCVGTAVRIGLPKLEENLPSALRTGPVRLAVRDGAYLATSAYGDGLWPADLEPLESQRTPTLASVAAYFANASPVWDALLSTEYGIVAARDATMLREGLPLLRLLGRATPAGLATLRTGGRVVPAQLDLATAEALSRFLIEDAAPQRAARRAGGGRAVVTAEFRTSEVLLLRNGEGFATSIDAKFVCEHPEVPGKYFADFAPYGVGVEESATLTVADLDGKPDGTRASVVRRTGDLPKAKEPGR